MSSERSRYRNRDDHQFSQFKIEDFINLLPSLGADRLAGILAAQKPIQDIKSVTEILNYVINVSELVSDHQGHEFILDEILRQVDLLVKNGNSELAKQIATYSVKRGHEMIENFEEGYSRSNSLEGIESWLEVQGAIK